MKAEIKVDGTLVVKAESELEAYAIKQWADDNFSPTEGFTGEGVIVIDTNFPAPKEDLESQQ